eukprot:m.309241 g.309241  ORF g.309241 m.309241 type:complete len:54 (+) comp22756_c0_seq1:154-315(+)
MRALCPQFGAKHSMSDCAKPVLAVAEGVLSLSWGALIDCVSIRAKPTPTHSIP